MIMQTNTIPFITTFLHTYSDALEIISYITRFQIRYRLAFASARNYNGNVTMGAGRTGDVLARQIRERIAIERVQELAGCHKARRVIYSSN